MTTVLRINKTDLPVTSVRWQKHGRSTVTFAVEMEYAAVVALFSDPGEWSVVIQNEDEPEVVKDCTGYDMLCSIHDRRGGKIEVVMGKMTDSEVLAELLEALK